MASELWNQFEGNKSKEFSVLNFVDLNFEIASVRFQITWILNQRIDWAWLIVFNIFCVKNWNRFYKCKNLNGKLFFSVKSEQSIFQNNPLKLGVAKQEKYFNTWRTLAQCFPTFCGSSPIPVEDKSFTSLSRLQFFCKFLSKLYAFFHVFLYIIPRVVSFAWIAFLTSFNNLSE